MASTGVKLIGECSTLSLSLSLSLAALMLLPGLTRPSSTPPLIFFSISGATATSRHRRQLHRGIYHGKQCHAADIPAVIARAWAAGVDRIIVTGGSLKESREVLEIAETDGELSCLDAGCFDYVMLGAFKEFEESGDPEGHFQALLALAKEGIAKGKLCQVNSNKVIVQQVLEVVAGCKGISDIEGLSKTLYHNTCRFFFPQDLDASADAQLESGAAIQNS
ncbi:Os08g0165800 [Oryza sativa Japonica Group]|uniref:Os08g0165800 protein n=1 Tax=Oryza sativa subsp. japonica TaxID=39947 RepID=C7J666_ORYSJ|nr:Os08g0165800 [Oryza sativa Japonica Group]|eukprot:NP_001175399.1 Os08g0165800 [Oryza sativa Japonica Group]